VGVSVDVKFGSIELCATAAALACSGDPPGVVDGVVTSEVVGTGAETAESAAAEGIATEVSTEAAVTETALVVRLSTVAGEAAAGTTAAGVATAAATIDEDAELATGTAAVLCWLEIETRV
jgi:hypothetical protein